MRRIGEYEELVSARNWGVREAREVEVTRGSTSLLVAINNNYILVFLNIEEFVDEP